MARRQKWNLSLGDNIYNLALQLSLLELIGEIEYIQQLLLLVVFLPGNFEYICLSIPLVLQKVVKKSMTQTQALCVSYFWDLCLILNNVNFKYYIFLTFFFFFTVFLLVKMKKSDKIYLQ